MFPDLEALHFVGRAITPPKRVRRFDTRFFAVDRTAIADEVEGIVGPESELVELTWVTIAQAKALDLPPITHGDSGRAGSPDRSGIRPPAPGPVLPPAAWPFRAGVIVMKASSRTKRSEDPGSCEG